MKIIEPKVELWQQGDDSKAHVARCARVCYGRETVMMKLLLNDLLMMNIGVCFVMELII
jgi:hypothetical protein